MPSTTPPIKLAVLASGRGSNFLAIHDRIREGKLAAEIVAVISDKPDAPALDLARERGIDAIHLPYDKNDRQAFEQAAAAEIDARDADLVILAGFMRIVTPWLVQHYPDRILNIHPSLLPSFRGLHAQRQAIEHGVKIAGCTVHLVNEELDAGRIIAQRAVPVLDNDTEDRLSDRILIEEHQLYAEAIAIYASARN